MTGFTPAQVFTGQYLELATLKQQAPDDRYARNAERFVKGRPTVNIPPEFVAINPVAESEQGKLGGDAVNFPTLTAAGYRKQ